MRDCLCIEYFSIGYNKTLYITCLGSPVLLKARPNSKVHFNIYTLNNITCSKITFYYPLCFIFLSIFIWVLFDNTTTKFQFVETFSWSPMSNFYVSFGVDGISLFFVLLTTLFTPIALLCSWEFPNKGPGFLNKGYVSAF